MDFGHKHVRILFTTKLTLLSLYFYHYTQLRQPLFQAHARGHRETISTEQAVAGMSQALFYEEDVPFCLSQN